MHNVLKIGVFAAATMLGVPAWATPVFTGPTSPYFLDEYLNHQIYVVQGTSVSYGFAWAYGPACTNFCEGSLAVTNVVSTNWWGSDFPGSTTDGRYTLSGTPTGTSWAGTTGAHQIYDGTSDGTHNYTLDLTSSTVIQTDLNWQNPVGLFLTSGSSLGVTYDPNNNSLWTSTINNGVISDYSLTGTLLSSFATSVSFVSALAFDPADGTLWFSNNATNELFQYSTSGTFLQSGVPTGLPNERAYNAGEFA
jgi:hypothetical protein